ncbi:hypothetical protein CAF53_21745 [Sphingobium sp. LB126]|nr:hypothetical protein CAF53_21745 [Sphingobium sp. LB126]
MTACCYAESERSWIAGAQDGAWAAFYISGDATDYGNGSRLSALFRKTPPMTPVVRRRCQ